MSDLLLRFEPSIEDRLGRFRFDSEDDSVEGFIEELTEDLMEAIEAEEAEGDEA